MLVSSAFFERDTRSSEVISFALVDLCLSNCLPSLFTNIGVIIVASFCNPPRSHDGWYSSNHTVQVVFEQAIVSGILMKRILLEH